MPAAAASGAAPRCEAERVKVSVRVRPLNARETAAPAGTAVAVSANQGTAVVTMATVGGGAADTPGAAKRAAQDFQFDHVFWSVDAPDACGAAPATQVDVFKTIGYPLVQHAFDGFNSCLFAYGQTGSGKTHTMMGADVGALCGEGSGVTPRICLEIFARKAGEEAAGHSRWSVELGYVEVYNERVSDLLARRRKGAKAGGGGGAGEEVYVDVREHPSRGVFLEGQRLVEVTSLEDVVRLIELGNGVRHTAATKMNDRSSRSHAIIMLLLREERTMTTKGGDAIRTAGKSSRMNLVDLAGSERVAQSQVEGQQFKEATHINLSLTTLGRVIDVLADMAKRGARAPYSVAPFRDSKLTFILKDSLGGNSKTFMVATVSPSALNYEETLSTLRYASRARDIVTVAQVNEDPRARRIRELEEQMAGMRETMAGGDPAYVQELEEKLALLESEAQKRAADLQALEKEKEHRQVQEQLLRVSEAERSALESRASALQQEMSATRRQADEMQALNLRLREEQARKERELLDEMAKKDAAFSMIRRGKDAEIASGREKLETAVAELEREQRDRESTLDTLQAHQAQLQAALQDTQRTTADLDQLRQQLTALQTERTRLTQALGDRERLSRDLQRVRSESAATELERDAAQCALSEMEARYHAAVFHLQTLLELTSGWSDALHEHAVSERDAAAAAALDAAVAAADSSRASAAQMIADLEERLRSSEERRTELEVKVVQLAREREVTERHCDARAGVAASSSSVGDAAGEGGGDTAALTSIQSRVAELEKEVTKLREDKILFGKKVQLLEQEKLIDKARLSAHRDAMRRRSTAADDAAPS